MLLTGKPSEIVLRGDAVEEGALGAEIAAAARKVEAKVGVLGVGVQQVGLGEAAVGLHVAARQSGR